MEADHVWVRVIENNPMSGAFIGVWTGDVQHATIFDSEQDAEIVASKLMKKLPNAMVQVEIAG